MRDKNKAMLEIGMNLLFCGVAFGMYVASHDYDFLEGTILGARTFPLLIGGILVVFAVVNVFGAVKRLQLSKSTEHVEPEGIQEERVGSVFNILIREYRVLSAVILLVLYFLLLSFVGFLIATVLLIPAMLYLLEYRKPLPVVVITVLGTAFLFTAFQVLLGVPLPDGSLFG